MLESAIQTKIKNRLEKEGWIVVKLIKTSMNGIPDLMALKDGTVKFIEVKQTVGILSELQKIRIKQLKHRGFEVLVWNDYESEFKYKLI
jgi:Holliday junction resolvase